MDFEKRYRQLNTAQKSAVDQIDGPVMVIAGPGTGKTELLSMRAANILRKTDTDPENILCLTFTDAGSIAMQKRLTSIIGRDAYNVSIFTFHAFGSEIMNKYREYFYNGADFHLADDLVRHKIITEILDSRDYNSPLRSQMNGRYTSINDIIAAIGDLKRAGLTDEEFRLLLDQTQATVEIAGQKLTEVFADRVSKSTVDKLSEALIAISDIDESAPLPNVATLKDVLVKSIKSTLDEARAHEKVTPPITAWKDEWMTSGADKSKILKIQKALPKLRELNIIYGSYLKILEKAELLDYDDMIMQTVHAIEVNDDLRYDLQEKYQYIMVDEFQDTNMAQMRILHNLTNNPVVEDSPNILVVGDDDQAIYGFQGAEVSNILNFRDKYKKANLITLTENYRSSQTILDGSREVIVQGDDRLESKIDSLNKTLQSHRKNDDSIAELVSFPSSHDERKWIGSSVKFLMNSGVKPSEVAIIARKHSDLINLLGYMASEEIPISYDKRENVLDDEVIVLLELLGNIVHAISIGDHMTANSMLPELLSHPAWQIKPTLLWEISIKSYETKRLWMELLAERDETRQLFEWLVGAAAQAKHAPLEIILDILIGNKDIKDIWSPIRQHYFPIEKIKHDASSYVAHLDSLSALRQKLRDNAVDMKSPKLVDFLQFIDDNRKAGINITSLRHLGDDDNAVRMMTAHGSKGLEFDHVFIINGVDTVWGEKVRGKSSVISFPPHLRLRQNNDDYDERLRLFYVAMTRARKGLHISFSGENDSAKETLRSAFLLNSSIELNEAEGYDESEQVAASESQWYAPIVNIPSATMREYLAPILSNYKLSATHINRFTDIVNSGPHRFLLDSLLHFPAAPAANANYGTAIHRSLQRAHEHLQSTGSHLPEEDVLQEFEKQMDKLIFTDDDRRHFTHKGCDTLRAFLNAKYDSFKPTQLAELDFARQNAYLNDAHLTGKLDVVELDKETMTARVIDYKTGGVLTAWDKGDVYKKVKAYKYRQQLLFYKLLIENSRDWRKYKMNDGILQFVEPNDNGEIMELNLGSIEQQELDRFEKLVQIIWQHVQNLSFPDTSEYDKTIDGIKQFEDDLLAGKI